jgi:DNA-binding IclR family transcriptional regulator
VLTPQGLSRYIQRGLKAFTPQTITSPQALADELRGVTEAGYGVDREEFGPNFCCVAAPIFDEQGHFVAALGLSTTLHIFDSDRDALAAEVLDVARGAAGAASLQTERGGRGRPRQRLIPVT